MNVVASEIHQLDLHDQNTEGCTLDDAETGLALLRKCTAGDEERQWRRRSKTR